MSVTVYGHTGVVGSTLYRWLREKGHDVTGVSLDKRDGEPTGKWAFLCLPTLNGDIGQDQRAIRSVVAETAARFVVVRSTVLPGTCRELQREHREKVIWHWPEFLSERTAYADFCAPRVRIVGGPREPWEAEVEPLLPVAPVAYVSTETSETLKYTHNVHGAMQVLFANMLYDVCSTSGANWNDIRCIAPLLGYISPETTRAYWDVWKDGKRGYGGHCFPKDVEALARMMGSDLLDGMQEANCKLRLA